MISSEYWLNGAACTRRWLDQLAIVEEADWPTNCGDS